VGLHVGHGRDDVRLGGGWGDERTSAVGGVEVATGEDGSGGKHVGAALVAERVGVHDERGFRGAVKHLLHARQLHTLLVVRIHGDD